MLKGLKERCKKGLAFVKENGVKAVFLSVMGALYLAPSKALAAQNIISVEEIDKAASKIRDVVKDISIPVGAAIIFASIVVISMKIIISHANPNKRSEAMGGLAWVTVGAILLGSSMLVAGIIAKVADM